MDALLTINAGTQKADVIAPAKVQQKHEQKFGKELNRKRNEHRPEKKSAEKCTEPAKQLEQKKTVAHQQATEPQQAPVEQSEAENSVAVAEGEETLQVAEGSALFSQVEVVTDSEIETVDSDAQLVELGESLEVSVDESDLEKAEEVVTPEQSVVSLPLQQPSETVVESQVVEQTAVAAVEPQQQVVVATQNRVAMLQEEQPPAGVTVAALESDSDVALTVQPTIAKSETEEVVEQAADAGEKVDPRFAALLKPRAEKPVAQPLRDAAQLHGSKVESQQVEAATLPTVEGLEVKQTVEPSPLAGLSAKDVLEQLAHPGQHLQGQGQVQAQGFDAVKAMPQTPVVQLSNGTQIAESQIFDQVVTHLSGSVNGETGRMVLRLQPAELGSLRLELKIEGDRVQAHLHAQTHQVQEVLERNLPQLRSALAEQGLKVDQFQVNVDQRQAGSQFEEQAQHQQHGGAEKQPDWQHPDYGLEEQMIPLAHLMQNGGGGLSLHV